MKTTPEKCPGCGCTYFVQCYTVHESVGIGGYVLMAQINTYACVSCGAVITLHLAGSGQTTPSPEGQ